MLTGRQAIADYVLERAEIQEGQGGDQPTRPRNKQVAAALRELATYILALPADDERIANLTTLLVRDGQFIPFAEGARVSSLFGVASTGEGCGIFLTKLVRLTGGYAWEP
jgi:hypothetical protein